MKSLYLGPAFHLVLNGDLSILLDAVVDRNSCENHHVSPQNIMIPANSMTAARRSGDDGSSHI